MFTLSDHLTQFSKRLESATNWQKQQLIVLSTVTNYLIPQAPELCKKTDTCRIQNGWRPCLLMREDVVRPKGSHFWNINNAYHLCLHRLFSFWILTVLNRQPLCVRYKIMNVLWCVTEKRADQTVVYFYFELVIFQSYNSTLKLFWLHNSCKALKLPTGWKSLV